MFIVKLIDRKGNDSIWQLRKIGPVEFDHRPDWLLVGAPIGGPHKELKWIHSSETYVVWIRQINHLLA